MSLKKGFIVATDVNLEWLLPWWWKHYSLHNTLPVTFVDFGMSDTVKTWCKSRGNYLCLAKESLPSIDLALVCKEHIPLWEKRYGSHLWKSRHAWFKKPFACLVSPYETTVWMDVDCQVTGSLESIFAVDFPSFGAACTSEYSMGNWLGVNTGVILFQKQSQLISKWALESFSHSHLYAGDQDALSAIIAKEPNCLGDLPICYNHSRFHMHHLDALIIHWHGMQGKELIASSMNQSNSLSD